MRSSYLNLCTALGAALLLMLTACGGGEPAQVAQPQAARRIASGFEAPHLPKRTRTPLAAPQPLAGAEKLMDWGEGALPGFFSPHAATQSYGGFQYRYYPATGVYLGVYVTEGGPFQFNGVYVAGGPFGGLDSLTYAGTVDSFITVPDEGAAPSDWMSDTPLGLSFYLGKMSTARLTDGSTLVLREDHGINPNTLVLTRYDAQGNLMETSNVASQPADPYNIGRATIYDSTLKVNNSTAFVMWRQFVANENHSMEPEEAHVRRWTPWAGLEPDVKFASTIGGTVTSADIAANPDGNAVAVWTETVPSQQGVPPGWIYGQRVVSAARYVQGSGWQAPVRVTQPGNRVDQGPIKVTAAAAGNDHAVVMWSQGTDPGGEALLAATLESNGSWSQPQEVFHSLDLDLAPQMNSWQLAIDDAGNAMASWSLRSRDGQIYRIDFNRYEPANGWGESQTLTGVGQELSMSMNRKGQGVIAWREGYYVAGVWFDAKGFNGIDYLSTSEIGFGPSQTPLAVAGGNGRMAVVWLQQSQFGPYAHGVIRGTRYVPGLGWEKNAMLTSDADISTTYGAAISNAPGSSASLVYQGGDYSGNRGTSTLGLFDLGP